MTTNSIGEFAGYLLQKNYIAGHSTSKLDFKEGDGGDKSLRKLWELTDLSANDFADEVARFYRLPRLALPELLRYSEFVEAARFRKTPCSVPARLPSAVLTS